jgi:hypothetical protein
VHSDSPFCHNCGIKLAGRFCSACGQKAVPLSVTLHDFIHELTHEILHVDGRIVQSIRRLLSSPGFLTREYIQGRRAGWISPIRLYLIASVIFFGLSALTGLHTGVQQTGLRERGWDSSFWNGPEAAGDDELDTHARKLGFANGAEMQDAINRALRAWVPRVMFVLMPMFAWIVALAYRRVDRNYLHHLIFSVHAHAAWFAAAAIAKAVELVSYPIGQVLEVIVVVFALIYVIGALGRVYGRARSSFVRIAFVLAAYVVVFVIAYALIVIPVVFGSLIVTLL